jgi:hypothetical protein
MARKHTGRTRNSRTRDRKNTGSASAITAQEYGTHAAAALGGAAALKAGEKVYDYLSDYMSDEKKLERAERTKAALEAAKKENSKKKKG